MGGCLAISTEHMVKVVGSANDSDLCNCSKKYDRSTVPGLCRELHPRALQMREVVKAPDSPNAIPRAGEVEVTNAIQMTTW